MSRIELRECAAPSRGRGAGLGQAKALEQRFAFGAEFAFTVDKNVAVRFLRRAEWRDGCGQNFEKREARVALVRTNTRRYAANRRGTERGRRRILWFRSRFQARFDRLHARAQFRFVASAKEHEQGQKGRSISKKSRRVSHQSATNRGPVETET